MRRLVGTLLRASIPTCLVLVLVLAGCARTPEVAAQEQQGGEPAPQQTEPTGKPTGPAPPYTLELSFPDGAPALNRVARLKVMALHKTYAMEDVQIELVLPAGLELVSGSPTWSASTLPYGDTEVIDVQVRARQTGNWTIEARLRMRQGRLISPPEGSVWQIYVSVLEDSAEWDVVPFWLKGPPFEAPIRRAKAPSSPLKVDLSMAEAPALNAPATLTCTVSSVVNAPHTTVQVRLPGGAELVGGTLAWEGDLKARTPVSFSAELYTGQ